MDSDDSTDANDVDDLVAGLEELDEDLFGKDLKKNVKPPGNNEKLSKETQKKVGFANNSDDDSSIYDLLNDKSDEKTKSKVAALGDSKANKLAELFNYDRGGSTTTMTTATSSTLIGSVSNTSTNDFKTIPSVEKPTPTEKWPVSNKPNSTEALKIPSKPQEIVEIKREDNPGLTRQYNEGSSNKRSALIDDMFGTKSRAVSLKDISSKSSGQTIKNTVRFEDNISESMPNLLNNNDNHQGSKLNSSGGFTLTSSSNREPRRRRAKSTLFDDPLGLLGSVSKPIENSVQKIQEKSDEKKQVDPQIDLPDWLSGEKKLPEKNSAPENTEVVLKKINDVDEESKSAGVKKEYSDISRLTEAQLEQQAAIVVLQQQEHELRTAKILSEQTDQLNHIVLTQKSKIEEQERMFNSLVKSQVERQANLDTHIKMQQARIDHYIQALKRQPSLPTVLRSDRSGNEEEEEDYRENKNLGNESLINKLEIEKQSLENIVDILRAKQEAEIKILEDSHETQMQFMRASMEKLEQKLQNDTELLEKFYENKIEKLVHEKKQLEVYFKLQIETLKTNNAQEVKEIYQRHSEQIKLLQKEQAEIIENICRSKELERQTVDFIQNKKIDLDTMLKQSQTIFDSVQSIAGKFNDKEDLVTQKRENSLKKQEEHIQEMRDHLSAQQEALENERKKLFFSAEKLEAESSKLSLEYKKNLELQNERESRIKIREQALMREKELFLEQTKWEREHIQYVKEAWTVEQRRQLQQLCEEREKLFAEKAKMEVINNLKSNSDDLAKAELEAALRTAREISKESDLERARWQERIASIDAEKKRIKFKEKALMEKAKELEDLTQSAIVKRDEGIKALKEAHRLEKQQKDRMSQLQMQLEMIAQRENKIASEKLSLARDRLGMISSQREKPERDVTSNSYNLKIRDKIQDSQIQTRFSDIVDPQLIMLKLNLDNKLDTSNQLLSDMQITD